MHMSRAVAAYQEAVEDTSKAEREAMLAAADDYNRRLFERHAGIGTKFGGLSVCAGYHRHGHHGLYHHSKAGFGTADLSRHGRECPASRCRACLRRSLPVGGENTFCVLSGHRGMPDARLFTDIDQLVKGDIFIITVLDRKIAYQVDDISTVLPREVEELLHRRRQGLLHARHVHAIRHQYPSAACARSPRCPAGQHRTADGAGKNAGLGLENQVAGCDFGAVAAAWHRPTVAQTQKEKTEKKGIR